MKSIKLLFVVLLCVFVLFSTTTALGKDLGAQVGPPVMRVPHTSDNSGDFHINSDEMNQFVNVEGPLYKTEMPTMKLAKWEDYHAGAKSRLAILLTDENSAWLSLAHGLKSVGVPFTITRDYKEALSHAVVLVYPSLSGKVVPPSKFIELRQFVQRGGSLIGITADSLPLRDVFGFFSVTPTNKNREVRLANGQSALLNSFTDEREKTIPLGDIKKDGTALGVYSYSFVKGDILAKLDDGSAVITKYKYGKGIAYAWGIDVGHFLQKCYSGRTDGMSRSYINEFDPAVDTLLRLIKEMYISSSRNAVTIGTVPFDKKLTVLFTHDIDYGESQNNAPAYAEFEQRNQAPGTYFLQTKYVTDYNDRAFFSQDHMAQLQKLASMGIEVASHGVSHSYAFDVFPMGTGSERYPGYQPFVYDRFAAKNGTVMGELRVSKYLLEKMLHVQPVVSFRPGHLSFPRELPQTLESVGYCYSSTLPANVVLSHLPFQLSYGYEKQGNTAVFEFPLTFEDELSVRGDRVQAAVDLASKISKYGGIYVVLIHPNIVEHKLQFERDFYEAVKGYSWFTTVSRFGAWWGARNQLAVDVECQDNEALVKVEAPLPLEGVTICVPEGWMLQSRDSSSFIQNDNRVTIIKADGVVLLPFTITMK